MSLDVQIKIDGATKAVSDSKKVEDALGRVEDKGPKVGESVERGMERASRAAQTLGRNFASLEGVMTRLARAHETHASLNNTLAQSFAGVAAQIEREKSMLDTINGPMKRFEQDVATLNGLFAKGQISGKQYFDQIARAKQTAGIGQTVAPTPTSTGGGIGSGLSGLAATAGISFGAHQVLALSDSYTNLQNRLRQVTTSQADLSHAMARTKDIAQSTRSDWATTGESFVRLVQATKTLGVSQERAFKITETLSMALQSSGASASEAAAGTLQLMQAMSSGALQGDEFRSIAENLPSLMDILAKQLGVTRGELKKMGAEGKITSQIMVQGLEAAASTVRDNFAKSVPTAAQQWTVFKNELTDSVGSMLQTSQLIPKMGDALKNLGPSLKTIAGAIGDVISVGRTFAGWLDSAESALGKVGTAARMVLGPLGMIGKPLGYIKEALGVLSGLEGTITDAQERLRVEWLNGTDAGHQFNAMLQKQIINMQTLTAISLLYTKGGAAGKGFVPDAWDDQRSTYAQIKDSLIGAAETFGKYRIEANATLKALHTPLEKHQDDLKDVKLQLQAGILTLDEYTLAVKRLNEEYAKGQAKRAGRDQTSLEAIRYNETVNRDKVKPLDVGALADPEGIGLVAKQFDPILEAWAKANRAALDQQKYLDSIALAAAKYKAEMASANDGVARGFNKIGDEINNTASLTENLLVDGFHKLEDSIVDMAMTGKASFSDMISSMQRDLYKLALRKAIGGVISSLVPGVTFAPGFDSTGSDPFISGEGKSLGSYTDAAGKPHGFATGGSFTVGGHGGTDTTPIAFMATPGERVSVDTPAQQAKKDSGGGGGSSAPMNLAIHFDERDVVRQMETSRGQAVVVRVVRRALPQLRRELSGR